MLVAFVCVRCGAIIVVGVRGVVVAGAAVVRMRMALLARAFLVMAERQALTNRDGRHGLDRDRKREEDDSNEPGHGREHLRGIVRQSLLPLCRVQIHHSVRALPF